MAITDVFFSEYVEGSANNKALEIYNGTGATVDLTGYQLLLYVNGAVTPSFTLNLTGIIANNDVFVLGHASANASLAPFLDYLVPASGPTAVMNYNGDDAIVLRHNGVVVDSIGQIGNRGFAGEWGTGLVSTADNTLRRIGSEPDTNPNDAYDPVTQWQGYSIDTFSDLGSYTYVPCFIAGAMIRTPDGEKAIEALVPGDLVVTVDGRAKPVKFIGRQTIVRKFADQLKAQPVIIKAGALGENTPSRDLYTSPGHAMLVDGRLVLASALVNGASIVRWQRTPEVFTYYHVELETHDVVFANDAATETFCDCIPREVFDNGAEYLALYPDAKPIVPLDLPTVKSARQLPAATRQRLAARATAMECALVCAA